MAVDASIPLSTNPAAMAGPDLGKTLSLAELAQNLSIQKQKLQSQNALKQILSNPQSYDPRTGAFTPQAIQATMAVDPAVGMQVREDDLEAKVKNAQIRHYATEEGKTKFDFMSGVAGIGVDAYDAAVKSGKSEQEARSAAVQARNEAVKKNGGVISDEDAAGIMATPFDPLQAKVFAKSNPEYSARQDKEKDQSLREREEITSEKTEKERERSNKADEGLRAQEIQVQRDKASGPQSYSAPVEIQYTDKAGKPQVALAVYDPKGGYRSAVGLQPIEGTEFKQLKGGDQGPGARSEVFIKRTLSAANEGVKALQNVMELPIESTSRGFFGGRSQGTGLMEAAKETLTNKATSQEVQDYQTMVTGLTRNLAQIESAGLAPAGSLTHNMEGAILKEGDTNLTKLRKMAEARQIIEQGIEPNLHDPKIGADQKQEVQNLIESVKQAVPFTQHDLTQYEYKGKKNESFNTFMAKKDAPKFSTEDEVHAAAARGDIKPGTKITVNGRLATYQE